MTTAHSKSECSAGYLSSHGLVFTSASVLVPLRRPVPAPSSVVPRKRQEVRDDPNRYDKRTEHRSSQYDKKSTDELKFRNVYQMNRLFGSVTGS